MSLFAKAELIVNNVTKTSLWRSYRMDFRGLLVRCISYTRAVIVYEGMHTGGLLNVASASWTCCRAPFRNCIMKCNGMLPIDLSNTSIPRARTVMGLQDQRTSKTHLVDILDNLYRECLLRDQRRQTKRAGCVRS